MSVAVIYGHDTQKIWTGGDVVSKKNQTNKKKKDDLVRAARLEMSENHQSKWPTNPGSVNKVEMIVNKITIRYTECQHSCVLTIKGINN